MGFAFISTGFQLVLIYTVKKMYYAFKDTRIVRIEDRKQKEKQFYKKNKYFLNFGIALILTGVVNSLVYKP